MSNVPAPATGIHLKTSFFPLAFMLAFFKPDASVDGGPPVRVGWGESFLPASPGTHRLDVWFEYMFFGAVGKAEGMIDVPGDGVAVISYKAPFWLVFLPGKLQVEGAAPAAALPAGGAPAQPVAPSQPVAQAQPATPAQAPPQAAPAPGQAPPPPGGPQWDAQRNAYVQWDQGQQRWFQFDDATQQWRPLT